METNKWNNDTIKALRKSHNLTQAELADLLGCRQQTISEWELGMYAPKNAYVRILNLTEINLRDKRRNSEIPFPTTEEVPEMIIASLPELPVLPVV